MLDQCPGTHRVWTTAALLSSTSRNSTQAVTGKFACFRDPVLPWHKHTHTQRIRAPQRDVNRTQVQAGCEVQVQSESAAAVTTHTQNNMGVQGLSMCLGNRPSVAPLCGGWLVGWLVDQKPHRPLPSPQHPRSQSA